MERVGQKIIQWWVGWAVCFLLSCTTTVLAQTENDTIKVRTENGIIVVDIPGIEIIENFPDEASRQAYMDKLVEYERLRRNIQLVYPLAKACAKVIDEVDADLAGKTNPAHRKKYLRKLEKELFDKYEDRLKKLTITQGKLLIKLIDRQCEADAYALIEEYKSWRSAAFWQLVANVFGTNLKMDYDKERDAVIEAIIQQIDRGEFDKYTKVYH
jgi:hypothetical protein